MADQDYTQDKSFMAASPEDQHSYLMHADPGYAKASPDEQKAFISHLRAPVKETQNPDKTEEEAFSRRRWERSAAPIKPYAKGKPAY